ncbi:S8 family peptidase [Flavobacterium sp.]|uniref:S8 family peptidase n=1 Tax=Flavobacterium sp. TaxID=239 RepID=UPI002634667E|nr:S8 family peptidase [Flavobacterium sp.]
MKNILFTLLLLTACICTAQQVNKHSVYVCLNEADVSVRQILEPVTEVADAVVEKAIQMPQDRFDYLKQQAEKIHGNSMSVEKLNRIYKLTFTGKDDAFIDDVLNKLTSLPGITYAIKERQPVKPPIDILPITPDYFFSQEYIQGNPGVNMQYAWDLGYAGSGVKVRDIEYGVNVNHEDLSEKNVSIAEGMTVSPDATVAFTEHGTAVIGVVYADHGTYGISGMAHEAEEAVLYPEWTIENGYNRIYAITQAIAGSDAGDVIIYEMQVPAFSEFDFVPAEYDPLVWDLTKAATDAGIVILAAAGNGSQNLNSTAFAEYNNRGDSGAVIVGAGTYDTNHDRLGFSTYGDRVNVQAWGYNVMTTGYGDLFAIGNDFNQYYTLFSGTSAATPIVASCAVVLQSYYYDKTGNYLTSQQIRDILVQTGIQQGFLTQSQPIGPLPDMQAAIAFINANLLSSRDYAADDVLQLFPNPVSDKLTIMVKENSIDFKINVYNTLGQVVYSADKVVSNADVDLSDLGSGVYIVEVKTNSKHYTKRIIKQ